MIPDNCKYKNENDEIDNYGNKKFPYHNYRIKDESLSGTGAGEVEYSTLDGVLDG